MESPNSPQIAPSGRLFIPPTGLAMVEQTSLGNHRADFMKEKVEHSQCVLCALLCPGPCFPSSPEEMQRCFWNVILDNSGYQVTLHLAIQTGWMSQQKGRREVGERGKAVEESGVKSKVMTRGA